MNKRIKNFNQKQHSPPTLKPNNSVTKNNTPNRSSTLINTETSEYFSSDPNVVPYYSNANNLKEYSPRYISIFDLPNIHEVVKLAKCLVPVYEAIRPYTLPVMNSKLSSKLYSIIKYRIRNQKPFLPASNDIERYVFNFSAQTDLEIEDLRSYSINFYNSKVRTSEQARRIIRSTELNAVSLLQEGIIIYFEPIEDPTVTSITISSKIEARDILVSLTDSFSFTRKNWVNVHLVSKIDQSLKNHEVIKVFAACFDFNSPHPALFRHDVSDGNVSVFCSKYKVVASVVSAAYSLVTFKTAPIDSETFRNTYPKIIKYQHLLVANNCNFSIVIRSDKVDVMFAPPPDFDLHSYVFNQVIFIPTHEDNRRFTLITNQQIPMEIVKCAPYLDNFNLNRTAISMNMRGVKTIGLVANKASGKSSLIKLLPKKYVIIDSDLYGQLLNHLRVTLSDPDFTKLQAKDYPWLFSVLDEHLVINDNVVELVNKDVPSFIELIAQRFIDESKIDLSAVLYNATLNGYLSNFKNILNGIYKLFPLESYYHVICDWALRKFSQSTNYSEDTYCVVFGHYSYELYSLLGGAMFYLAFPGDPKLNLFLRERDTPVVVDLFLQQMYELCETRSYNSQPSGLMLEVLMESGKQGD